MIANYNDFLEDLLNAGFSMGGGSDDGIYATVNHGWTEEPIASPIRWHSGDPEVDPWEWRMRVLHERNDIAYAKLFFKKSGFITKEWYPYFLAARRGNVNFEKAYEDGKLSHAAKRIYEEVAANAMVATHEIKQLAGFGKDDKAAFDKGLTELQMGMFITMCGKAYKSDKQADNNNAWASTVFCTTENFFGEEVFEKAAKISKEEACEKIRRQILILNPEAQDKKIAKFILG